jgi:hypothetical protein
MKLKKHEPKERENKNQINLDKSLKPGLISKIYSVWNHKSELS